MSIWRFLFCAVLCALPSFGLAETIRVVAGEHDGYVRIVFHPETPQLWQVDSAQSGVSVRVADVHASYDFSAAFSRIGRDRVTGFADDGGGHLDIALGCDCDWQRVLWNAGSLYIDVFDPKPDDSADHQPRPSAQLSDAAQAAITGWPSAQLDSELAPELRGLERELTDVLSGAADLGLLQSSGRPPIVLHGQTTPEPSFPISVFTLDSTTQRTPSALGAHCLDPAFSDLTDWRGELDFPDQIASLRAGLVALDGALSSANVVKLARAYVAHGFGQEAMAVLRLQDTRSEEIDLLVELAEFVDGRQDGFELLPSQQGCDSNAGLVAFVLDNSGIFPSQSKLLGYSDRLSVWPMGAGRDRIVQMFADRVNRDGHAEAAALTALPDLPESDGNHDFAQLLSQDAGPSGDGQETMDDLASSVLFEHRHEAQADLVLVPQLRAVLARGGYQDAVDLVAAQQGTPAGNREAASILARAMIEEAPDGAFLTYAFDEEPYALPSVLRRQAAVRLNQLGFFDRAALWHPDKELDQPTPETPPTYIPAPELVAEPSTVETSFSTPVSRARSELERAQALQDVWASVLANPEVN